MVNLSVAFNFTASQPSHAGGVSSSGGLNSIAVAVNESDGKTGQALQIAGIRRETAGVHLFRIDASIEWIPINPVPPVVRAFNEFFFLTCKIA